MTDVDVSRIPNVPARILTHLVNTGTTPRTRALLRERPAPPDYRPTPRDILRSLDNLEDIINFSLVCKGFNNAYVYRFSPISRLYVELLDSILGHVSLKSANLLAPGHRASLSVQSFASIPLQPQEPQRSASQINAFVWRLSQSPDLKNRTDAEVIEMRRQKVCKHWRWPPIRERIRTVFVWTERIRKTTGHSRPRSHCQEC